MKILFVAKRYYTNKDLVLDRFGRLFHLPLMLAGAGHEVCVVAFDYKTFEREEEKIDGLDLLSLPSRSRGLRLSTADVSGIPAAVSPDVVVGSGHLHLAGTARNYAMKTGAKFVFEAYDYYPAFLPGLLRGIGDGYFKRICRKANGCIAASERLGGLMSTYNDRISVIENGYDPDVFKQRDRARSLDKLGLDGDRKYICFIGSASDALGYDDFVAAMKRVRKARPEVMGLHAGAFNQGSRKSDDVINMGMCTQDKVADILSASACGVVPYRESLQVAYSNSCKLVEYMACGLPIVATRSGDNTRVLGEAGGQLVETSDPVQLGDSIIKQLDRPIEPPFPEKWQWSKLGSRLDQFLGELCGNQ